MVTIFNNTIADTINLQSATFETITREGTKYYAVISNGKKEETTSFINGQKRVMVKDGDGHENVTQEGVTLRWAPMDMQTFQKGIDNGYVVERYAIVRDDEVLSVEEISKEKTKTIK